MFWNPVPVESINELWGQNHTPPRIQIRLILYKKGKSHLSNSLDFFSEKLLFKVLYSCFAYT